MANDAYSQQALASDPRFRLRVKAALGKIAWQILTEDTGTANHNTRAGYARTVLSNLDGATSNLVGSLVMRTNVFNFATSVTLDRGQPVVETASGDPDIESQIATDWNLLAGV